MAVRATLTLVAVSAVTLAGIAVIHINQKTERQACSSSRLPLRDLWE